MNRRDRPSCWPPFAGITQARSLAVDSDVAALAARFPELARRASLHMLRPTLRTVKAAITSLHCEARCRAQIGTSRGGCVIVGAVEESAVSHQASSMENQRARELEVLAESSRLLTSTLDLNEV